MAMRLLIERAGMADAEEFAVQQNAYVRARVREGPMVIVVHAGPSSPGARATWRRQRRRRGGVDG